MLPQSFPMNWLSLYYLFMVYFMLIFIKIYNLK
nr:ATP synthase F0 subunit 8 [Lamproglena orientalis]YP_010924925.1 ATP synthase F0 subunit 8 [Lamproglena orientalis]WKB11671.1 ATP synthase F0 subunit 8 [Lamproglena orientalis]WKB11684.1 ATP synthase F0 subunit 8 [Lamproglena orientalis]WKB11697.1 ATP synthase F0 subunit 8 [Lamproglena orientalis]WKB11710.1 ATP synthase F0 subunit 8 [Lamproglena orientalis]WKB11723.1 ATP synthase F0 subunit 8 [Lamproglena orientalis]